MPLVPNVVGSKQSDAVATLQNAGLKPGAVTQVHHATIAAKSVVSTIPTAGAPVDIGSAVDLQVSSGPATQVEVPDVTGLTRQAAEVKLKTANLVVGTLKKRQSNLLSKGGIIRTDPKAGSLVNEGTAIGLELSKGPKSPDPLIPGALLTLIGVFLLLYGKKVNGVIVCYVGAMTLVVAAGKVWMQHIYKPPDLAVAAPSDSKAAGQPVLDDADRRAQSENAILVACCVVGLVITALAIVCVATVTVFKGGTTTGLLWGLGSLFSGGFVGFLFGIPSETERAKSTVHVNTSLNQINDWLTKIIVGVSLVNAKDAYIYFVHAASTLGAGLASDKLQLAAATAFAAGLIITFFFLGFTGTYLLTRLWISAAILRADLLTLWLSGKFPKDEGDGGSTQQPKTSAIITADLPDGTANTAYPSTIIQTAGLTPPLNWTVTPSLPPGLNFDPKTGTVSGTPTATAPKTSHKFTVTDSATPPNVLPADLTLEIK